MATKKSTAITEVKIKDKEEYYLLMFDGYSSRICFGKLLLLSTTTPRYVFRGDGIYKIFSEQDITKAITGKPLRAEIKNGKLSFMALFVSEADAERSVEVLAKTIAVRMIENSLDADSKFIVELRSSMMKRLSIMNEVTKSKNLQEMATSLKRSIGDKNSNFTL
jgi:hypothetical protein